MVKLEIFDSGIRIGSSVSILKLLVPTWEASKDELDEIRPIAGLGTGGFRFRILNSNEWIIFWTFQVDNGIDEFVKRGYRVTQMKIRFNFLDPNR
jgi:hypothetical protein